MPPPFRDMICVILRFLYDNKMAETAQSLERESKVHFNLKTFTEMIEKGQWVEVDKYLRSFTDSSDNYDSMMVFWRIGIEKYLEALDEKDFGKALSIIDKDLKPSWLTTPEDIQELTELIPLENFREKRKYAKYGDTKTMRAQLVVDLMKFLNSNPKIKVRLSFPHIDRSRLETLLSQSIDWQRFICYKAAANPAPESTLFANYIRDRSLYFNRLRSVDTQLMLRNPYRNDQNHEAGPSFATSMSMGRPNFNHWNFHCP